MPTILKVTLFDENRLPLVADFDCSEREPATFWEDEINEWIRMDPAGEDGAHYWLAQERDTGLAVLR